MIKQVPRAWAKFMHKNLSFLVVVLLLISINLSGQSKVMLLDGQTMYYSDMDIEKESVILRWERESSSVLKSSILCVIPENKKSGYTFMEKNNKKILFGRKLIQNNYQGGDVVKMLGAKYYKSGNAAERIYQLYPVDGVSREAFIAIFNETQKKIKTNTIIGIVASTVALIIGVASLMNSMNQMGMYSYHDLDTTDPVILAPVTDVPHIILGCQLALKDIA